MQIVISLEGRVRTVIRSSFVAAKRLTESQYTLSGDNFQMTGVTAEQVLILPDSVTVHENDAVTDEMKMQALPFEGFIAVSAEEALPNVLGLLLRSAVADGKLTDEELLSVQPALEGRVWQAGLSVQIGDVYSYAGFLWRCIQAHSTQSDWLPDKVPALWHKVEIVHGRADCVRKSPASCGRSRGPGAHLPSEYLHPAPAAVWQSCDEGYGNEHPSGQPLP